MELHALVLAAALTPCPSDLDVLLNFPGVEYTRDAVAFAKLYEDTLPTQEVEVIVFGATAKSREKIHDQREYEARYCAFAWETLLQAHTAPNIDARREALCALRGHLGKRNFYGGRMPPVVPTQYFATLP